MIVVTGATGGPGAGIVRGLLARLPADRIVASVRDPARAASLAAAGVRVRRADFDDPAGLDAAFAGATQVLIVSADRLGEEGLRPHRNAIAATAGSGARRILYTSHIGARTGSPFAPAGQHAATEAALAASGVASVALRHGFYAESCLHMVGDGLEAGELRTPEDGPVSRTARADLAEADAAILASDRPRNGIATPLVAARPITMAELAAIASEASGRTIRHVTVTDDAWRAAKLRAGMPAPYAEILLETFRAARRGDFASTDRTLEDLLGRPPTTMRDVLRAAATR